MVVVGPLRRAVSRGARRVVWRVENVWRGRWDKRSKIFSWCCGGSHFGRYFSRKVITGLGKVWNFIFSLIIGSTRKFDCLP